MFRNVRAISRLWVVVLMLISFTLGTFVSYLWVMGSYYNMPENTTLLIVTDATFPVNNSRYFNVTILNPSNSISDVNVTAIRLIMEENNETYEITDVEIDGEPISFPYEIKRGTEQTFKCKRNWSDFAGKLVRIQPVTITASTKSYLYKVPTVKLIVDPTFDPSESVQYFMLTVKNTQESEINLTISEITLFEISISENLTANGSKIELPQTLPPNAAITFQCNYNWQGLRGQNVTLTVKTSEGYETKYTTNELRGAVLEIKEIKFNETDCTYFNVTIENVEDSTAAATIIGVNLTLPDDTTFRIDISPPLNVTPIYISLNESITIKCLWDWYLHRNETVKIDVYAKQGFTVPAETVTTPPSVILEIQETLFNLTDTNSFRVNVKNLQTSLQNVTVSKILVLHKGKEIFKNETIRELDIDKDVTFACTWNWTKYKGENVTITVDTVQGFNAFYTLTLPVVTASVVFDSNISNQYFSVNVQNNAFSAITVTGISVNETRIINATLTYPLLPFTVEDKNDALVICPFDWQSFSGTTATVVVSTSNGFEVTVEVEVP